MKTNWPLCSPNRRARARLGRRAQGGAALEVGAGAAMGGIAQPGAHTPGQDSGPSRHGASPNGSRGSWDTSNRNAQNADDAPPPVKAETDAQARRTRRCGRPGWAQPQHCLPPAPGGSKDPARPPVTARGDYLCPELFRPDHSRVQEWTGHPVGTQRAGLWRTSRQNERMSERMMGRVPL